MTGNERFQQVLLPLDERAQQCACFLRVIGLDPSGDTLAFLKQFYNKANAEGLYLADGIANPSEPETERFYAAVGTGFQPTEALAVRHMTVWLGQLRPAQRDLAAKAIWEALALLRAQGANENILKNAYVKYMCWLRAPFGRLLSALGGQVPPKVLFEGDISKHEVIFLTLLHQIGCDVVYVHFTSEEAYRKIDRQGTFSVPVMGSVLTPPAVHFAAAARTNPPSAPVPAPPAARQSGRTTPPAAPLPPLGEPPWKGMTDVVTLNTWAGQAPAWEAVLIENKKRGMSALHALFAVHFGADERAAYRNRLYGLKTALAASARKWCILAEGVAPPSAQEAEAFRSVCKGAARERLIRQLALLLTPACGRVQQLLAQRAFSEAMTALPEQDLNRLYNHGVRLACWVRRYAEALFEGYDAQWQPALVFYGPAKEAEITLLWVLAQMGADVLYFSPDPAARQAFEAHPLPHIWTETKFAGVLPLEPYPVREEKMRASTTAYDASRELDELLYSDTGMFRDRQFVRSQPVTLKTTFDEVLQLWKEQAQYRPSFETKNGVVYVPNLFCKIDGVDKGDAALYWERIRGMITEQTHVFYAIPFLESASVQMTPARAKRFLHGGKLDPKALKASEFYQYDYLPDDTQDYILEKIQALMDYDMIVDGGEDLGASMLTVLMNLDKDFLRLIQNFDFPHVIPKILVIDLTENMFSLEECIFLAFFNLIGFDIAVFTPTGYRNLEKYLRPDSFERIHAGEYQFNLTMPNLNARDTRQGGDWLSRIFGGKS